MEEKKKIKQKQMVLMFIGIAILVVSITGITFAFFNYTKTGGANIIQVGRIGFSSEQTNQNTINLSNVFPIARTSAATDDINSDEVVITITGDTTNSGGLEYLLTATAVENTTNSKEIPISVIASASNGLGTADEEYFENRGQTTAIYKVLAKDTIENNDQLLVGYIPSGEIGVNGTLTIRAFIDETLVSISDTYDDENGVSNNMGTSSTWIKERINFTTEEWNETTVSFKVKVEAREGTWVNINTMNTFPTVITDEKTKIKEVYFNKMEATRMQNAYDAATIKADLTYNNEGKVLAWLKANEDDNTKYNLIVASDGQTYLTTGYALFSAWENMEKIEFNNVNTSRVTDMSRMFLNNINLKYIDMQTFDTSNVISFDAMFYSCLNLEVLDLSMLDTSSMSQTGFAQVFVNDKNLTTIYASEKFDLSNLYEGVPIFSQDAQGVYSSMIFNGNTYYGPFSPLNLVGGNGTRFSSIASLDSTNYYKKKYLVIDKPGQPGYLTDISLKPTD